MNESPITKLPDGSGCFTATILSNEEIAALPIKKRPISARISSKMYHDIFEKIGSATMAWSPRPTGVFNSEEASQVAVELCFTIADELENRERKALLRAADIVLNQALPENPTASRDEYARQSILAEAEKLA